MFLTTDAMKVFKSRQEFKCQPIAAASLYRATPSCVAFRSLLIVGAQFCLNLPPWIRYRDKNRLALGWILGPNEAWDTNSFFYPIVREGPMLARGLTTATPALILRLIQLAS